MLVACTLPDLGLYKDLHLVHGLGGGPTRVPAWAARLGRCTEYTL
jgi:hypothetical protein